MGLIIDDSDCYWTNDVVPYSIDGRAFKIGSARRRNIERAVSWWSAQTYLTFVKRGRHKNFIMFRDGKEPGACSSPIGMQGGCQEIFCFANGTGVVAHEIGHSLGLYHEQSRSDRNKKVTVHLKNVKSGKKDNFCIRRERSIGIYDYDSIMHYGRLAFTKNGKNTITPKGSKAIGQRQRLSQGDKRTIEIGYGRRGDLLWYRHRGFATGSNDFTRDYGQRVGTGWQRFRKVFAAPNGIIYAIETNGDLKWYRHRGVRTGRIDWVRNTGRRVGTGWQRFRTVMASSNGLIYAVEKNGDLRCYKHNGYADGRINWADNGKIIGTGWQRFTDLFMSSDGVIYAVERNGDLKWYRHTGTRARTKTWAAGSGKKVGSGWQRFLRICATSGGFIYAVERNYDLKWYQHRGFRDGANRWARSTGKKIGTGWKGVLFASDRGILYRIQ